jgi:flavodoxin
MKTLIVYKSVHRKSTEMIAKAMAEAMNARLASVEDVKPEELTGYDLIGFGSGIYNLKHHKVLIEFVEDMPPMKKDVFVFSTTGNFRDVNHRLIKEKLTEKGCKVVGEFACFGLFSPLGFNADLPGPLVFIGGKNRGHPDAKDLEDARAFAKGLLK